MDVPDVALLTPVPKSQSRIEQLRASARMRPGTGGPLPTPVEPKPGVPLPSEVLAEVRADER